MMATSCCANEELEIFREGTCDKQRQPPHGILGLTCPAEQGFLHKSGAGCGLWALLHEAAWGTPSTSTQFLSCLGLSTQCRSQGPASQGCPGDKSPRLDICGRMTRSQYSDLTTCPHSDSAPGMGARGGAGMRRGADSQRVHGSGGGRRCSGKEDLQSFSGAANTRALFCRQ